MQAAEEGSESAAAQPEHPFPEEADFDMLSTKIGGEVVPAVAHPAPAAAERVRSQM